MFAAGLVVFGLASAAAAFAPSFEVLVAMRFTQGVGAALTAPAAVAVLRALYSEPGAFGRAMATWGGVSVLGATVGTVTSGAVTTWVSWRWMFAVPLLVAVLALAVTRRLLPAGPIEPSRARAGLDPAGATLGISVGSYGLIVSGDHAGASTAVLVPLAVGAVLLGAFLAVERRVRDPLLPPGFTLEPSRIVGLAGMLLAAAGSALVSFLLLLYLQQERDWSPLATAGVHTVRRRTDRDEPRSGAAGRPVRSGPDHRRPGRADVGRGDANRRGRRLRVALRHGRGGLRRRRARGDRAGSPRPIRADRPSYSRSPPTVRTGA